MVRGPKSAEELAQRLLRNKAEVMAALDNGPAVDGSKSPVASESRVSKTDESSVSKTSEEGNSKDEDSTSKVEESIPKTSETMTTMASEMTTTTDETDFSVTDDTLTESGFANWIRRPDATGRWGWERPGLPEVDRWWARSTFRQLPELPPPCPTCRGVLWWGDLEGGRHCLDCERTTFEQSGELSRLAHRLRAASGLPAREAETKAELPAPGELRCDRCKGTQLVEATTHGGRTVRLDCARCGRFVAWRVWYGKLLVDNEN